MQTGKITTVNWTEIIMKNQGDMISMKIVWKPTSKNGRTYVAC